MSLKHMLRAVSAAALLAAAGAASAAVVTLDFEGIGDNQAVGNYYNGASGAANNYGVTFSASAFALVDFDAGGSGNFGNEPSPNTVLFFADGAIGAPTFAIMNYAAGFDTGFAFFYSSVAASTVEIFAGANATGALLATFVINAQFNGNNCQGDPNGQFCNWSAGGGGFMGTALSVRFNGAVNQTAFDNVTFGAATPGSGPTGVPEPASLALVGAALLGAAAARRRKA